MSDQARRYWVAGCILWIVGSASFLVTAIDAEDVFGVIGSALFLIGIVLFLIPLTKGE